MIRIAIFYTGLVRTLQSTIPYIVEFLNKENYQNNYEFGFFCSLQSSSFKEQWSVNQLLYANFGNKIKSISWINKENENWINLSNALIKNIDINDCWFNVQQKGSQLIKHTHPNATLSGALYINVDNNSSPIYFYNPVGFLDYTYIKEYTDYTFNWFKFNPNPGDLIIWPSWLSHGSNTNINETDDRIVISFNAL